MLTKFLDPKNDFAFKQVFGQEKNKDILIHFLNDVLNHKYIGQIVDVTFLERAEDPDIASKKQSMVDVRCQDQDGAQYIIEMQVADTGGFEQRAQYYAAKAYSRQLLSGQGYERLKEVIFLAITNFVMFPKKLALKSDHVFLDDLTHDNDLKGLYFTFIELPKFKKGVGELESPLDYWCYYLKHAPETSGEEYELLIAKSPIIKRAYGALDQYSWSEAAVNTYEAWMKSEIDRQGVERKRVQAAEARGIEKGIEKGMEKGIEKGMQARELEIAKQMRSRGMDMRLINELTGLSAGIIYSL